jgi:voltage-gated potassium channel Kch
MREVTFRDRVRYRFDNLMSRGPIALLIGLGILSLIIIVIAGAIISLGGITQDETPPVSFFEAMWESLVRTLDSGTFGGDTGIAWRIVMLGVTLGGVFVVSALIGIINNGLEQRMDEMRKGRSFVIEHNHTLILNWSPKIFTVISELVEANANQAKPRIVILAEKDKVEMEDEIKGQIESLRNTKVICRTGSPLDINDLEIANPHDTRSIIVLAPPDTGDPDSEIIKTILALTNNPNRRKDPYHIVAEIADPKNLDVAKMVGKDEAEMIVTGDLISRIIVQTSRQSGLSIVYTELLDFGGDEIYFKEEPTLIGKTFGESLLAFEDSAVLGLRPANGSAMLNPPMDMVIQSGDRIIAVSEDDDTIKLSSLIGSWDNLDQRLSIDHSAIHNAPRTEPKAERTLILGWNARGAAIVLGLDSYVAPQSEVKVVADLSVTNDHIEEIQANLKNQRITFQADDTTHRAVLNELAIHTFDQVIVLAYSDALGQQEADARTLITLLHLRDISEKSNTDFRVVSEMLDVRNRELAEVTKADDFIVSNKLTSLMLSQVAENKELNGIFTDMFDPDGSEIYLKPAGDYVELGKSVNFYTIVEAARSRGHAAFGYRIAADAENHDKAYGVVVNPDKSNKITFTEHDRIVVAAED